MSVWMGGTSVRWHAGGWHTISGGVGIPVMWHVSVGGWHSSVGGWHISVGGWHSSSLMQSTDESARGVEDKVIGLGVNN